MRELAWVFQVGGSRFSVFLWSVTKVVDYITTKSRGLSGGYVCVVYVVGWGLLVVRLLWCRCCEFGSMEGA